MSDEAGNLPPCVQPGNSPAGKGALRHLDRVWHILRYYRWWQLARRAGRILGAYSLPNHRFSRLHSAGSRLEFHEGTELHSIAESRIERHRLDGGLSRGREILANRYRFLNVERHLPGDVLWCDSSVADLPRLWRFHLQYHEFLLDLAALASEPDWPTTRSTAWQLVLRWIEAQEATRDVAASDAWHPYCISKRVPNWILLWEITPPPIVLQARILSSLHSQSAHLHDRLEWDVQGNHLLENMRALALAGAFFRTADSQKWLQTVSRILPKQLAKQILPHGEHFERSPGYHAQMLEAVLDIRDATRQVAPELSTLCVEYGRRMACFLQHILRPDGRIPLWGDSVSYEPATLASLVARANNETRDESEWADGGKLTAFGQIGPMAVGEYWTFRDQDNSLQFDAGPVGADSLPAHAHSDLLHIEVCLAGQPLIVDSGVFDYEDSPMRRYCRSTAAHSTLEIDDLDQCDTWSRFRMGYRGHPTKLATGNREKWHWAQAGHNAYRRQGVALVRRSVICRSGGPWYVVDRIVGSGRHLATSRLHLNPQAIIEKCDDTHIFVRTGRLSVVICPLSPGRLAIAQGWNCPAMGYRNVTSVATWRSETQFPTTCGWQISWRLTPKPPIIKELPNGCLSLCWGPDLDEQTLVIGAQ